MSETARIELGRIVRPIGVRGEVRLLLAPDFWPEALESALLVLEDGAAPPRSISVLNSRQNGNCLALRLGGVDDREAAESLRDAVLTLPGDLGDLDVALPDEPLPCQLQGLSVLLPGGDELGKVIGLQPMPGHPLLLVRDGDRDYQIPFVEPIITGVDLEAGSIGIDPPEGLLEL